MLQTKQPRKYLLHITDAGISILINQKLELTHLQEALSEDLRIAFPEGNLKRISTTKDTLIILIWNFAKYIDCSKASDDNFAGTFSSINYFAIQKDSLKGKGDISLPYFTLCRNKKTADFISEEADVLYTFPDHPDTTESERLQYLSWSLVDNRYDVKIWAGTKMIDHYCEFSGGGDLYIAKENLSSVLVFVVPKDSATDEDPPATESSSQPLQIPLPASESSSQPLQLSPLAPGSTLRVPFTIEGKKDSCDIKQLERQLLANMIVISVAKFKQSLQYFSKEELLELKKIIGYGMACSGEGVVGVFKLEMDLIEGKTTTVCKLPLGPRERLTAAALMDYTLDYYQNIIL